MVATRISPPDRRGASTSFSMMMVWTIGFSTLTTVSLNDDGLDLSIAFNASLLLDDDRLNDGISAAIAENYYAYRSNYIRSAISN